MADEVKKRIRSLLNRDFGTADIPSALSGRLTSDYPVSDSALPQPANRFAPVPPAIPRARPLAVNVPVKAPSPLDMGEVIGEAPQRPAPLSPLAMGEVIGRVPAEKPEGILSEVGNQLGRGWNRLQQAGNVVAGTLGISSAQEMAAGLAGNERDIQQYPQSENEERAFQEWEKTEGFLPSLGVLVRNPTIITGTMFESLPQSAPGMVGGIAGGLAGGVPGAMAGVGVGSGVTEAASTLVDTFREAGVNMQDERAVLGAFANAELMAEAKRRAVARGVAVGLFDGLTAGISGKVGLAVTRKLGGTPGAITATTIEGTGGAAGEAAGQIADKGKVEDWGDVALEGVAELPGGIADAAGAAIGDMRGKTPAAPAGPGQTFTIRDPAIGGVPGSPLDGEQVAADPDQTGVRANMTRVILPDGSKAIVGNRLLEPIAEEQNPAGAGATAPPVGDGASVAPVPPPPAGPVPSPSTPEPEETENVIPPARGDQPVQPAPAAGPEGGDGAVGAPADLPQVDPLSRATLRKLGHDDADIDEMSPEELAAELQIAEGFGIDAVTEEDVADAAVYQPERPIEGSGPAVMGQDPAVAAPVMAPAAAPGTADAVAPSGEPGRSAPPVAAPPVSSNRADRQPSPAAQAPEADGLDALFETALDAAAPPQGPAAEVAAAPAGDGTRAAPVTVTTSADLEAARDQAVTPTPAQAKAGNYKKGHARLYRMPISVENPAGSMRTGTDPDGNAWESELPADYGYLKGTKDRTGEPIDIYIGPNVTGSDEDFVYVIDQFDPKTGKFDEPKVIFGTKSFTEAHDLYDRAFADGSGPARRLGSTGYTVAEFRQLVREKAIGFKPLDPAARKRSARRPRKGKPVSAIRFVQNYGGIKGYGSDLRHLGLDRFPGLINEKKGSDADYVREALAEAGYFGGDPTEDVHRTTLNDLWDLLTSKGRYSSEDTYDVLDMQTEAKRATDAEQYQEQVEAIEAAVAAFEKEYGPMPATLRADTQLEMQRTGSLDVEAVSERVAIYGVASYIDEHSDLYDADEHAWWDGVRDEIVSEPVYDDIQGWDTDYGDAGNPVEAGPDDGPGGPLAEGERGDEGRGEGPRNQPEVRGEGEGQERPVTPAYTERVTLDGGQKANQGLLFGGEVLATAPKIRKGGQQDADFGLFAKPKADDGQQLDIEDAPAAQPEPEQLPDGEPGKDEIDLDALFDEALDAAAPADTPAPSGFPAGLAEQKRLQDEVREASDALKPFPRTPLGKTPDAVRATPEWQAAKARYDRAFKALRDFNGTFIPQYKDELRAEREASRNTPAPSREPKAPKAGTPARTRAPKAPAAPKAEPRQGKVGDMLASGEVVLTATGRETTPFPTIKSGSERKAGSTIKAVERWLMANALAEAEARGDNFNARQFRANLDKPSQADKDSAEYYLFDPAFIQPVPRPILKPLSRPDTRTAADTAKDAVKNVGMGLQDVASGLSALFGGPNKLGSGPSFDPETYAKAKPYFLAGVAHFRAAAKDIAQLMQKLVSYLVNEGGMSRDAVKAMQPYVVQFVRDVRDGAINLDEGDVSGPRGNLEQGGTGEPANGDGATPVPDAGGRAGRSPRSGGAGARGGRRTADGGSGVSDAGAAPVGGGGDQPGGAEGRDGAPGAAGGGERGGSDPAGGEGLSVDDGGADEASAKAALVRAGLKGRAERDAAQKAADQIPVKSGIDNIRQTLPLLSSEQQEDVAKAEESFKTRAGMLFTNGTGTGKTYSGAGVIKRFHRQGKTNILVAAPSQGILDAWKAALADLAIPAEILADTNTAGSGVVLTTYANLRTNDALINRDFDLIVPDEAHSLSSNQQGDATQELETFRALTGHRRGFYRYREALHPKLSADLKAVAAALRKKNPTSGLFAEQQRLADQWRDLEPADLVKWQARQKLGTKSVFLSATPFPYAESVDWAEGYLFDYGKEPDGRGYNQPSAQQAFMIQHFGYRMRTGKLTKPDAEVDSSVMEREFHEHLAREGALSGRELEVDKDYERRFVLEESKIGQQLDDVLKSLHESENGRYRALYDIVSKNFDHLARRQLLEAINAEAAIPRIKKHLALGRKIVVFHGFNVGGGFNPFAGWDSTAKVQVIRKGSDNYQDQEEVAVNLLAAEWIKANRDIANLDFSGLMPPVDALKEVFGDRAVIYNGTIPKKKRAEAKERFNQDGSGTDIIVVQIAAGEAGISLHDTTGKHRRVVMQLGMPTRPTSAIQTEGRIYRVGQESDALFEYLTTGTNWERYAFAGTVAGRSGTAENLALGNKARTLKQSFIDAYQDADLIEPSEADGKGGKAKDRALNNALSPYDRAKTLYFAQGKGRKNNLGNDYFATPEPLGFKMVEWAGIKRGEKILEPSAGHGAIARFFPEDTARTVVEWSTELASRLGLNAPGARVVEDRFENLHVSNKYDAIVMNPPFGTASKLAFEHMEKATRHLRNGGRLVALFPQGPAADKRLEAFEEAHPELHTLQTVTLPAVTFERAGTGVSARVIVWEKQAEAADARKLAYGRTRDYSSVTSIKELFDRLENVSLDDRVKPSVEERDLIQLAPLANERGSGTVEAGGFPWVFDRVRDPEPTGWKVLTTKKKLGEHFRDVVARVEKLGGRYDRGGPAFLMPSIASMESFLNDIEANPLKTSEELYSAASAEIAANRPPEAPVDRSAIPATLTFKPHKVFNRKQGRNQWVAEQSQRVETEAYRALEAMAKKHGGWYSSWAKDDAVAGWQFKTEEGRDNFTADVAAVQRGRLAQAPTRNPFTGEPVQPRRDAAREAREMVRRVAGNDVKVIISETIGVDGVAAASLAANAQADSIQGAYDLVDDIIEISLAADDPNSTAFHEAWHRVEMRLLDKRELALLKREIPRLKAWLKTTPYSGLYDVEAMPDYEVTAFAAQAYEAMKNGRFPYGAGLHVGVRAAFDKLLRFLARVRNALKGRGIAIAEDLFQAAIDGKMTNRPVTDAGKRRHFGTKNADAVAQPAYHGTPHRVDRFTTEKVGTGEGNQTYGWGLYFAGAREVAEHYKDRLSDKQSAIVVDGEPMRVTKDIGSTDALERAVIFASNALFDGQSMADKASDIRHIARRNAREDLTAFQKEGGWGDIDILNEAADILDSWANRKVEKGGALYQVEVPEDHELMNWETQLSDQPEVLAKLKASDHPAIKRALYWATLVDGSVDTGRRFYTSLGNSLSKAAVDAGEDTRGYQRWDEKASKLLASIGIPGHRYDDQFSRDGKGNTYNYVIYADEHVGEPTRIAQVGTPKPAPTTLGEAYEQQMTGKRTIAGYSSKVAFNYLRRKIQDRFLPILALQRAAEEQTGAPVPDHLNVHMAEANYHRVAERREIFYEDRVQPIVDAMRAAGISQAEMDDFLKAKHAPERNAEMARRGSLKGAGAKWTDPLAAAHLATIAADPRGPEFERIAGMVYAMNKETRDLLVKGGLMDAADRAAWEKMYQFYVPLRGFEEDPDEASPSGLGRRFAVAGKEAKTAYGRESEADSPLVYSIMQGTTAIIRTEKVKVARSMHRFMNQYQDPDLYERYTGRWDQKLNRQGQIERRWVPAAMEYDPKIRETLFPVKFGSKTVYWKIHDRNLLQAMTGLGEEQQVGELGRLWLGAARFYAKLLTQWNPDFTLPNFSRDLQTALANISDLDAQLPKGLRTGIAKDAIKNVPLIFKAIRSGQHTHQTRYYDEFRAMGGKINFLAGLDVKSIKVDITARLTEPGSVKKAALAVGKLVGDINTAVENATRLAVYTQLREAGYSKERAANAAREVTVNFNRRGEWGTVINGAYLFFNASIQSSTRILSGIFSKNQTIRRRMMRIVVGIAVAGLLGDLLNGWLGGGDDDENKYDGLAEFITARNIVFMIPGTDGQYVTIPLAYGYNVPYVLGREMGKVLRGVHSPGEAAAILSSAVINSFSPLGENATWLQFASPTLLDPMAQHAENTDWTGRPIKPRYKQEGKPEAYNATIYAAEWAKSLSEFLNDATGGSPGRPGFIDMSPDVIEHYVAAIGGGAGATIARGVKTGWNVVRGEEIAAKDIPIVRRFYGNAGNAQARMDDFYEAFNRVNQAAFEVKTLLKAGDPRGANDVRKRYRAEISVSEQFKAARERLSDLRTQKIKVERDSRLTPEARRKRLDTIDAQQKAVIDRALASLRRAMERQPK